LSAGAGNSAFEPDITLWDPWTPGQVAQRLQGIQTTWYVLGGWALDLFHGRQTRGHEDLEIGVGPEGFDSIREALPDLEFFVVGDGKAWPLTEPMLSAHQQSWGRDRESGQWRVDVIREHWDGGAWVFRRDPRIRLEKETLILRTTDGIPYVRPEVVLLFKAKNVRPKDETDFALAVPLLDDAGRAWLAEALELVHPAHRWLKRLAGRA
jgi:hypothetical protein